MTNLAFDFDNVELALQKLEADISASETHGTLCALLCADAASTGEKWFQSLVPEAENPDELYYEATQILEQLRSESQRQLNDPTCDYQLLLPSDDTDITTRTIALGEWCQGFVMGLMMCGLKDFHKLPENSAEVCNDILEISRASSSYETEETEEDQTALEELTEYVRVGVLLINEELNPERKPVSTTIDYNNLH